MNWGQFQRQFGQFSAEMGRPALATRLLVGLHYLKCLSNVSDGGVVASWVENPYWQYFCGIDYFVHEFPCNPSSLVKNLAASCEASTQNNSNCNGCLCNCL